MKHVRITNANMEPVFSPILPWRNWRYRIKFINENKPEYDFTSVDGFGHHFWVISDVFLIERSIKLFAKSVYLYCRRASSYCALPPLRWKQKINTTEGEYNYFLAVHFPDNQLTIIDYNGSWKIWTDQHGAVYGWTEKVFDINEKGSEIYKPAACII